LRIYSLEKIKNLDREELLLKMDIVKTSIALSDEEKNANIALIDGILNPISKQDEAFNMMIEGQSDPVKFD
jgi:hypothetical protein